MRSLHGHRTCGESLEPGGSSRVEGRPHGINVADRVLRHAGGRTGRRLITGVGAVITLMVVLRCGSAVAMEADSRFTLNPYDRQVAEQTEKLRSPRAAVRAGAAEALAYLRAYSAAGALTDSLDDASAEVRREAVMALAWCGSRKHVTPLLAALDDVDWVVRQAAWVSLTNLTGMEWPFDALAGPKVRRAQAKVWRRWWRTVPTDAPPRDVLDLLKGSRVAENLALGCRVAASTTYRGPPDILTDGKTRSDYWQTKNVPFPQHCTIDLARPRSVGCVVVYQYGNGYRMLDFALSTSVDGKTYRAVCREKGNTSAKLVVPFARREARYIRITSYDNENRTYPTTFREIRVTVEPPPLDPPEQRFERGVRALGSLGGRGSTQAILRVLRPYVSGDTGSPGESMLVQAGLRSLGRLGDQAGQEMLVRLLDNQQWARYAADALGDFGGRRAATALLAAYPKYARTVKHGDPKLIPGDDRPGLSPVDRMYETPFAIASALVRLPLDDEACTTALREIGPLLLANLPCDFDGAMLYEPEAHQPITAYLLERAGLRRAACDTALKVLGQPGRLDGASSDASSGTSSGASTGASSDANVSPSTIKTLTALAGKYSFSVPHVASWLSALVWDAEDVASLIALLRHKNGWVRINAAKALMFMGEQRAVEPLAGLLKASKPEADYGYNGRFLVRTKHQGQDEYNDPSPRWREAFVRALGRLAAGRHVALLATILRDERNVLDIQHAAALALDEVGTNEALAVLRQAEADHSYHSIRLVAREALWRRNLPVQRSETLAPPRSRHDHAPKPADATKRPRTIVFIKGGNKMPNDFQIDKWRQTYSTTDSGPTYRLGRNLYVLRIDGIDSHARPLTGFSDGYVADCEVSWDARRVVFARRGGSDDPWWHIFEINVDGTGLRQITRGPYHDVQPAYLADGRIVFSSSRIGLRDEYHGYFATGLTVMNADGGDIHCIGFNLGRDNEPAVLNDGRIVFSRLELFYSRLKTELTVHAVFPDGTKDVTLYGPERRQYWRRVTLRSGENWWGEVPPRHRVLRTTQPRQFDDRRIIGATTGGLVLFGRRDAETMVPHDKNMAVTTPFPLGDGRVLCAATVKDYKRSADANAKSVDLGLYLLDAETGEMTLLYNDPKTADFEPRPAMPRPRPPALVENRATRGSGYTARLFCSSARVTRERRVGKRGKLVRVVEGMPVLARHHTHKSPKAETWRNHTGTHARVLGTVPLAVDGSFFLEVPADRMIHLQVLDSDRRVVGNQLIWMYARPGETRSCVGCHEEPDTAPPAPRDRFPAAGGTPPIKCLPTGGEFSYRAKFWNKGVLSDEGEERTRTVRAVNLMGRR